MNVTVVEGASLIEFTVFGNPEPGGSKRAFVRNGRARVVDANTKAKGWKERVAQVAGPYAAAAVNSGLFDAALDAEFTFFRPRPSSHYGQGRNSGVLKPSAPAFPTTRPDTTKLVRVVEDALTGVLWRDDAQLVRQVAVKRYGAPARVEVVLRAPREQA